MATTTLAPRIGQAQSSDCPKEGIAWLHRANAPVLAVKTKCKTYQCLGCRDRVRNLFKLRVMMGCSISPHSWLITVTLKLAHANPVPCRVSVGIDLDPRTALYVRGCFRRFLYRLKDRNPKYKTFSYMMIPELTKQGMPHLHLVAACPGISDTRSLDRDLQEAWTMAARVDGIVTSFITDIRGVYASSGAAAYLGKYLVKNALHREELLRLGFSRRFSRSPTWPGDDPIRLRGTDENAWSKVAFEYGNPQWFNREPVSHILDRSESHRLLDRLGGQRYLHYLAINTKKSLNQRLERVIRNASIP